MFAGIPKEAVRTLLLLSKLACRGFLDWYFNVENYSGFENEGDGYLMFGMWKKPKIIFTVEDLIECGIEVTEGWDGYSLLKVTHTHHFPQIS